MRTLRTCFVALALAATLVGCSGSGGTTGSGPAGGSGSSGSGPAVSIPVDASPAQIVSAVCTRCHNTDRIKAANHDAAAWAATVTRMRGKGAQLTDAQAEAVITFLAGGGASSL